MNTKDYGAIRTSPLPGLAREQLEQQVGSNGGNGQRPQGQQTPPRKSRGPGAYLILIMLSYIGSGQLLTFTSSLRIPLFLFASAVASVAWYNKAKLVKLIKPFLKTLSKIPGRARALVMRGKDGLAENQIDKSLTRVETIPLAASPLAPEVEAPKEATTPESLNKATAVEFPDGTAFINSKIPTSPVLPEASSGVLPEVPVSAIPMPMPETSSTPAVEKLIKDISSKDKLKLAAELPLLIDNNHFKARLYNHPTRTPVVIWTQESGTQSRIDKVGLKVAAEVQKHLRLDTNPIWVEYCPKKRSVDGHESITQVQFLTTRNKVSVSRDKNGNVVVGKNQTPTLVSRNRVWLNEMVDLNSERTFLPNALGRKLKGGSSAGEIV